MDRIRPARIWGVDAFAREPFRGNPAAVCLPEADWETSRMQDVAREMNLSETAFVRRRPDGDWDLRWFTPSVEVDLCGHATLAAGHVLWEENLAGAGSGIRFHTRSGILACAVGDDGIRMDFPARPAVGEEAPAGLTGILGADVRWCGRSADDLLVEVSHAAVVRCLRPDLAGLAVLPARGVIVTAASDRTGHDFVSRFFAPAAGIAEDPVTGSAHCTLGPYWSARLGRTVLRGWQASARGGSVGVEVAGDLVLLTGQAVTVWSGCFREGSHVRVRAPEHPTRSGS